MELFRYADVLFHSSNSALAEEIKSSFREKNEFIIENFFQSEDFILVELNILFSENEPEQFSLFKKLEHCKQYLEVVLNRPFTIDLCSYITTTDKINYGAKVDLAKRNKLISPYEIKKIENNPYTELGHLKSPASDFFLSKEYIFIDGHHGNKLDQFWRYLEVLFQKTQQSAIISNTAKLLLLSEKFTRSQLILTYFDSATMPWQFDLKKYDVTNEDYKKMKKELSAGKTSLFLKKFNDPVIPELVKIRKLKLTKFRARKTLKFYEDTLMELYELRNSITHADKIQSESFIKLSKTIPVLLKRLRWAFIDLIKTHPQKNFQALIDKGLSQADRLV